MGVALPQPGPSEQHLGMIHIAETLTAIGITLQYTTDLGGDDVGEWNGYTLTAHVRADAHPRHQAWLLKQVLALLLYGPAATPTVRHERCLTLVPPLPHTTS